MNDYIEYHLQKSRESFEDARLLAANGRWNASTNRLYYSCYYAVSALLISKNITPHTHAGCKTQLGLNFVKPGLISIELGPYTPI